MVIDFVKNVSIVVLFLKCLNKYLLKNPTEMADSQYISIITLIVNTYYLHRKLICMIIRLELIDIGTFILKNKQKFLQEKLKNV